jgi:hypothetical protein
MNPKAPGNLDPKLKETYERVMGTSFGSATPAPAQKRTVQTTVVQEPQASITPQPVATVPPPIDVANPLPEMVSSPQTPKGDPFKETVPPPTTVIMKGNATQKKKNILLPVFLVIGGLIFFVAYAVFWAKVFGLF